LTGWTAAVDLGSVAAKLLLTDGTERVRHSVDTLIGGSRLTSLGEAASEPLEAQGLARLAEALGQFRALADRHQADAIRAVTTAPGRRSDNAAALTALVQRHLGVPLEVLDGETEARLAFLGAVSDPLLVSGWPGSVAAGDEQAGSARVVTIDIGGGSTGFAAGRRAASNPHGPGPAATAAADPGGPRDDDEDRFGDGGRQHVFSLPLGGRSVAAAYFQADPPRPEELSAALSVIGLHVDDLRREAPELVADLDQVVVLGLGAVTTVAAIEVGLAEDPLCGRGDGPLHGLVLSRASVEDVFRTVATERRQDRAFNPGLPPTRVDDIVGVAAVLVEIMRQLGLERLLVSQRGLLDGVLLSGERL
jgi:exopolyphosphatase/guanosine-5'-triphosphate,3'-diphosphate pyrophosphatase